MAETLGQVKWILDVDDKRFNSKLDSASKSVDNLSKTADGKGTKSMVGLGAIMGATAAIASNVLSKAMNLVTDSISSAVRRVDTLNNSARTFENLGFSTRDVSSAMEKLEASIKGLPTPLDGAVRGMTMLASTYGDIKLGQEVFTSLNNAIIGFGGSAAMVDNAIVQLSQLPLDGPLDAATWRSLQNSGFQPVFSAMARQAGMTIGELKTDFGGLGTKTVKDFTDILVQMNKEGGGGMKSLEQIAKDATSGIGTGWENMKTAITRGISAVIQAIGSENIANAISNIGTFFEKTGKIIARFFKFFSDNKETIKAFMPLLLSIAGSLTAIYTAVGLITGAVKLWTAVTRIYNAVAMANPTLLILTLIIAAIFMLIQNWELVKTAAIATWGAITSAATATWDWISSIFGGIGEWFAQRFNTVKNSFISAFNAIKNTAQSVWNWIRGVFSTIGDVGSGIFRGAVNGVLSTVERTINGFIRLINGAINVINKIPGVSIGSIGQFNIPKLAKGGIVPASPGGTLAVIGEGGQDEAVIPLNDLKEMMGGNQQTVTIGTVVLGDASAVDKFFDRLNHDTITANMGLSPVLR